MNSDFTQTGVPIRLCDQCSIKHPTTRRHCTTCGRPTLFIAPNTGTCHTCEQEQPKHE